MSARERGLGLEARRRSDRKWKIGGGKMDAETKYQCPGSTCGYIYDPKKGDRKGGIPPGTPFRDLPDNWKCPLCGIGKRFFKAII